MNKRKVQDLHKISLFSTLYLILLCELARNTSGAYTDTDIVDKATHVQTELMEQSYLNDNDYVSILEDCVAYLRILNMESQADTVAKILSNISEFGPEKLKVFLDACKDALLQAFSHFISGGAAATAAQGEEISVYNPQNTLTEMSASAQHLQHVAAQTGVEASKHLTLVQNNVLNMHLRDNLVSEVVRTQEEKNNLK